jgi:uncharacterized protein YndB with AHSA1/START domain
MAQIHSIIPRTATHATFVIDKTIQAPPAAVFAAFSSREGKAKWFDGLEGWERVGERVFDFQVGGREYVAERQAGGGPGGNPVHVFEARYLDIVPKQRIVYAYTMMLDETRISVSLTTIELKPEGGATRLVLTEQGVFLDGHDTIESREGGTRWLLDRLEGSLGRKAA